MLHFNPIALFLVLIILLGVLSNNTPLTLSGALLLLMQQTFLSEYLVLLEKHGLNIGIVLLTCGVLSPLVSGKIKLPHLSALIRFDMLAAIGVGIFVAWVAGRGVPLMTNQPTVLIGLILGTIMGVAFLGGIPVGPLIAAGLLSLIIQTN
jgi:uncharacterized membrane protein (DUF441 family)